jgi:predicted RND superfamily exporter protein
MQALSMLPDQVADQIESLVGEGDPPTAGLLLVFQDTEGLDDEAVTEQQRELAGVIDEVPVADSLAVDPFSFGLLLTAGDIGPEIGRLFGTALAIILVILAIVYWVRPDAGQRWRIGRRTVADVGLTLAVIIMSVVWMQGIGVLLGPDYAGLIDYFSPQTQIVPILIVGLGVDFAIHLLARYRAELGTGADPGTGLATAIRTTGFTLLLVTAATAIGFLTNLASPVGFLATLGVLAASGIAAAFVLTLTFLPAIRIMLDRRADRSDRLPVSALSTQTTRGLPRLAGRTAWLAERVPVATLIVAVALTVVGGYGFTQLDSEFNLTDFVPQDEPLLEVFETLSSDFNGGFEESTQVLLTGDVATPEGHNATVEALQRAAQLDDVETIAGQPAGSVLTAVLGQAFGNGDLAPQLGQAGVREDLTVASDADVAALYDLLLDEVPAAQDVLARTDDGFIGRADLRTSAGQSGAGQLEATLTEAFASTGDAGVEATPVSQQIVQARQGDQIEDSQIVSLLIALGAAMALLIVHFTVADRRPMLGVITVLPVGLVLALTFGTMALTGIPLNPVTATLAALSIGIGVPFTIHVTSRFLEERRHAEDQTPMRRTMTRTGGALVGSALTTAIGFGILTTSTLLPFSQLGFVIGYAILYSLVASTLVLPSLLMLWDRVDRRRRSPDRVQPVADGAARS